MLFDLPKVMHKLVAEPETRPKRPRFLSLPQCFPLQMQKCCGPGVQKEPITLCRARISLKGDQIAPWWKGIPEQLPAADWFLGRDSLSSIVPGSHWTLNSDWWSHSAKQETFAYRYATSVLVQNNQKCYLYQIYSSKLSAAKAPLCLLLPSSFLRFSSFFFFFLFRLLFWKYPRL